MIEQIPGIKYSDSGNFFLLAGPCVVENETMPFEIAGIISEICDRLQIPFVFKASYRKANRSKLSSFTGIGDQKALELLGRVRNEMGIPVVTDIHSEKDARMAAQFADILQIPAFLCRQTELLIAAGETGKIINIKKGQFVSASSMQYAVQKVRETGNDKIMLTERGSMFGYNDLVVDYRSIPEMQKNGVPVILDATHSLQQPNQESGVTGGRPDLIATIAKAGIAVGVDGIFLETHPDPPSALSDGANMLQLDKLENLLLQLLKIRQAVR